MSGVAPCAPDQSASQLMQPYLRDFYRDENLNPHGMERRLQQEMMQLPAIDRNAICEEMHGVRCMAPIETTELIKRSLHELRVELDRIPVVEKQAFCLASASPEIDPLGANGGNGANFYNNNNNNNNIHSGHQQHQHRLYVDTDEFRLRFLRCELFDAKKAARRLVNYLELITGALSFESGGPVVLRRPITLADFTEEEHAMMRYGYLQLLPFRDRSGRRVLTGVASLGIRFDPKMWVSSTEDVVLVPLFLFVVTDKQHPWRWHHSMSPNGILAIIGTD